MVHKIFFFKFSSIDFSVIFNFIFKVEENQKSLSPLLSAPIQINFKQVISKIHHESRSTKLVENNSKIQNDFKSFYEFQKKTLNFMHEKSKI